jgi:peptidoglycan/LPS O-acetylase OafA/YrhL
MANARVNELDLLRFIAALAVVLFHYAFRGYAADGLSPLAYPLLQPAVQYGYLGVELFFLISGFVILMTAAPGNLRKFAVSRAVRLYPAFWICCTLTFIVMAVAGTLPGREVTFGQYLANLTMLSGFVGIPSIDGVYWSLFIELKFYALVAVVLLLGRIRQAQFFLGLWLLVTQLLILRPIGFLQALLITDYAPYFIGGATCFLIWSQGWSRLRGAMLGLAWLQALHLSGRGLAEFESHYGSRLDHGIIMAIVSVFFAVMLLIALGHTGYFSRRRWLTLGALTYPLYLLHQNIGYQIFNAGYPALNPHLLLWGTTALMLVAAYTVHAAVERPLSKALRQWLDKALDRMRDRDLFKAGKLGSVAGRGPGRNKGLAEPALSKTDE